MKWNAPHTSPMWSQVTKYFCSLTAPKILSACRILQILYTFSIFCFSPYRSCPLIGYFVRISQNLSMSLAEWVPSHSSPHKILEEGLAVRQLAEGPCPFLTRLARPCSDMAPTSQNAEE
jgi:hypothetical protein